MGALALACTSPSPRVSITTKMAMTTALALASPRADLALADRMMTADPRPPVETGIWTMARLRRALQRQTTQHQRRPPPPVVLLPLCFRFPPSSCLQWHCSAEHIQY